MAINKRKSITAFELIIVVVIIGLLAAITVPNFRKALIKSREKLAKANLQMILSAQKLYRASNNSFWKPDPGDSTDLDKINKALNLDIEDRYFEYSVNYISKHDFEAKANSITDDSIEYTIGPRGFTDD